MGFFEHTIVTQKIVTECVYRSIWNLRFNLLITEDRCPEYHTSINQEADIVLEPFVLVDELLTKLRLMKILCVLESCDELRSVLGDMAVNRASNIRKHPSKFFAAMNITEDNLGNVMRGVLRRSSRMNLFSFLAS